MRLVGRRKKMRYILFLSVVLVAFLVAACAPAAAKPAPSSVEVVEASYMDISANISDLRSRINEWEKGDEGSQKIAEEKFERIETLLGAVGWPEAMAAAVNSAALAVKPMAKALKNNDVAAAQTASQMMGDASHDITHAFYGDFMPVMHTEANGGMTLHPAYLDITANISDLRARVNQWQNGDEASINIAKEKIERIEVLLPHVAGTGIALKRLQIIEKELTKALAALEKKDLPATQRALKPISDASNDMTRDMYNWMSIATGSEDPACVQASYLDITRQITEMRAGLTAWQKGDEKGLTIAQESLARAEIVLAHPVWPEAMSAAVLSTAKALNEAKQLIKEKDTAGFNAVDQALGDASHDVIHAYYGDWLTGAVAETSGSQSSIAAGHGASGGHGAAPAASQAAESKKAGVSPLAGTAHTASASKISGGHNEEAGAHGGTVESGPNWMVIGGFLASLLLVVATASVMKRSAAVAAAAATRSNHDLEPA